MRNASRPGGRGASGELLDLAARIAEAQVDLMRVQRVRHQTNSCALADPQAGSPKFSRRKFARLVRLVERFGDDVPLNA